MKVLLINGSPKEKGCTYTALCEVAKTLNEENIETEIFHIGNKPIRGCIGCGNCAKTQSGRCVFNDDTVNVALKKWLSPRSLREFNFKYSKRHRTNIGSMLYFSY